MHIGRATKGGINGTHVRQCKKIVLIAAGTDALRNSPPRVRLPNFFVYRTLRPRRSQKAYDSEQPDATASFFELL